MTRVPTAISDQNYAPCTDLQADRWRGLLLIIAGSNACRKGADGAVSCPLAPGQSSVLLAMPRSSLGVTWSHRLPYSVALWLQCCAKRIAKVWWNEWDADSPLRTCVAMAGNKTANPSVNCIAITWDNVGNAVLVQSTRLRAIHTKEKETLPIREPFRPKLSSTGTIIPTRATGWDVKTVVLN